jgi:hypothetical protein
VTFENLLVDLDRLLATPRSISGGLRQLGQRMSTRCPEASGIASLVIKLYDPCLDERWILALWPSTQLLFATTATRLQAPAPIRRRLVTLLHQLRNEFQPATTSSRLRPSFTRAPFAAFHWSSWRAVAHRRARLYVVVATLVHIRVRALEHGMAPDGMRFGSRIEANLYSYLRAARVACMYAEPLSELIPDLRHELVHGTGDDI